MVLVLLFVVVGVVVVGGVVVVVGFVVVGGVGVVVVGCVGYMGTCSSANTAIGYHHPL